MTIIVGGDATSCNAGNFLGGDVCKRHCKTLEDIEGHFKRHCNVGNFLGGDVCKRHMNAGARDLEDRGQMVPVTNRSHKIC